MPETTDTNETPDTTGMNTEILHQMARLQLLKKEQDQALKETKRRIAELQEPCMNELVANGVERLPLTLPEGRITLYVHNQLWARPIGGAEGRPAVVEALLEEGFEDYVKQDFSVQSISAMVRESRNNGVELPDRLAAVLEISENGEIRARAN